MNNKYHKKPKEVHLLMDKRMQKLTQLINKHGFISVIQSDELERADRFTLELLLRMKTVENAAKSAKTTENIKKAVEILKSKLTEHTKKFKIIERSTLSETSKSGENKRREEI